MKEPRKCTYCEKTSTNYGAIAAHQKACLSNPCRVSPPRSPKAGRQQGVTHYNVWNRGLSKQTDERIATQAAQSSATRIRKFSSGELTVKLWTEARRKAHSDHAKTNNYGGYKPGSGKGRHGYCRGIWCDSSWEMAYVLYCTDHGIAIRRNSVRFSYSHEDRSHHYTPDFVLGDGVFLEIKGYVHGRWISKLEQFTEPLIVLGPPEMVLYLAYVHETYGKNFWKEFVPPPPK